MVFCACTPIGAPLSKMDGWMDGLVQCAYWYRMFRSMVEWTVRHFESDLVVTSQGRQPG